MAKGKRKKEDVDSYRHEAETMKNAVSVGLASYDTSKPTTTAHAIKIYLKITRIGSTLIQ